MKFYKLDLRTSDGNEELDSGTSTASTSRNELVDGMDFEIALDKNSDSAQGRSCQNLFSKPVLPSCTEARQSVIGSFLEEIPRTTKAFSESPTKEVLYVF